MSEETLVNRVAQSSLITIDPEKYYPSGDIRDFDFKDHLFKGLILREKDFRQAMNDYPWEALQGKYLFITCSADAIIPLWAYMLVSVNATPYVKAIYSGSRTEAIHQVILGRIREDYGEEANKGGKFVIKGCSRHHLGPDLYVAISAYLQPFASSIMFGEPCSTVPIYQKKNSNPDLKG